jgi:hypothetical protein
MKSMNTLSVGKSKQAPLFYKQRVDFSALLHLHITAVLVLSSLPCLLFLDLFFEDYGSWLFHTNTMSSVSRLFFEDYFGYGFHSSKAALN